MRHKPEALAEAFRVLEKQYGVDIKRVLDSRTPSIPATAFATTLTPLETAASYLIQGRTTKEVAKLLNRSTSSIQNSLDNAKRKGIQPADIDTSYRIPVSAFADTRITPAEAVILYLSEEHKLTNIEISRLIGRDSRNTWHLLQQARQKRGAA